MSVLTINKLTESVGAEVVGVDAEALAHDDGLASAVLDALEDNGVLVFHDLHLHEDPQAQVAFCERLGDIDRSADGHHPVSGIYPITLDKTKNKAAEYLKATFDWHIDGCTPMAGECPQKATVLSAIQVAARGGETEFANSYAAYETLSDGEKERYAALRVVHSLEASQRRVYPDPTPEQLQRWKARPTHENPLVWTHRNGRKSLVLGASADYIVGMDLDEGRALLDELLAHSTTVDKVYSH
ncbi:TauD/TfdA dioxygenase family protein, partial [Mycolicibacterium diernhoferi]